MSGAATVIRCAGCGYEAAPSDPVPFRCPRAGDDDVDHIMTRWLDTGRVDFPSGEEINPFVRYRQLFHSWHLARAHGMSEAAYVDLVERFDKAVAEVDGHGFAITPFTVQGELSRRVGSGPVRVWVKDETENVSGSHKARHLMGVMVLIRVMRETGIVEDERSPLAIASCGNAALAAAVVARAAERRLQVYVPTWADASIMDRLNRLEAHLVTCERRHDVPGDPTLHALEQAVEGGAIPFTCQGSKNGLTIEGGETLGYEMISEMLRLGSSVDRLFVQVGGGALASSCVRAFEEADQLGVPVAIPRIHSVQTTGGSPVKRAYDLLATRILGRLQRSPGVQPEADTERDRADLMLRHRSDPAVREEIAYARRHRSEFMWPWETEPRSVATGILDDETYDWAAVVEGMIRSGGFPVVASEEALLEANELARASTGVDVDHTGSSGLAGLIELSRQGVIEDTEDVAVLFTGARRGP